MRLLFVLLLTGCTITKGTGVVEQDFRIEMEGEGCSCVIERADSHETYERGGIIVLPTLVPTGPPAP